MATKRIPTRTCIMCGDDKPERDFYADASRKSGISPRCKECEDAQRKARRELNRDAYLAWMRDYRVKYRRTHPRTD